jgi:hypothetical protein
LVRVFIYLETPLFAASRNILAFLLEDEQIWCDHQRWGVKESNFSINRFHGNILTDLVQPLDTRVIVCFVLWETGRGALNHSKGRQTLN